jgi:hypothetical protein
MAGLDFLKQGIEGRRQASRHRALAAGASHHFDLQRAGTRGQEDLLPQHVGISHESGRGQHGGECRGAAVVFGLREEGGAGEFDRARQAGRGRVQQRAGLCGAAR